MKHTYSATINLLAWVLFSSAFTVALLPKFEFSAANTNVNPLYVAVMLIVVMALGTMFWLKFGMKKRLPEFVFSLGIGLATGRVVAVIFDTADLWVRIAVVIPVLLLYAYAFEKLKKKDAHVAWYQMNNLLIGTSSVVIGGMLGALFPLWLGLALFAIFAIYDAIAVWKTKHMITLATTFIDKGIIPGFAYPYVNDKGERKLALLGGGDIMFIAFAGASLMRTDISLAILAIITMTITVIGLFIFSSPKKFYPALPYLFAGMLTAFPIWWLIR